MGLGLASFGGTGSSPSIGTALRNSFFETVPVARRRVRVRIRRLRLRLRLKLGLGLGRRRGLRARGRAGARSPLRDGAC